MLSISYHVSFSRLLPRILSHTSCWNCLCLFLRSVRYKVSSCIARFILMVGINMHYIYSDFIFMRTSSNLRTRLPSTLPMVHRSFCIIRGKASGNLLFPGSKTSVSAIVKGKKNVTPKKSSDNSCHVACNSFKVVLCSEGTQNSFFYNVFIWPMSLLHTAHLCL